MKKLIILILFFMSLTGCSNWRLSQSEQDQCIPPSESFVYIAYPNPEEEKRMQVPPNWEVEREIDTTLVMSRNNAHDVELWFVDIQTPNPGFWVYNPASKQEEKISGEIENSGVYVREIYTDSNDVVWGRTEYDNANIKEENQLVPILSKLNEDSLTFEFVEKTKSIPYTVFDDDLSHPMYWTSMIIDQHDKIWFFVPNDSVYVYDPIDDTLNKNAILKELIPSQLSLAPDGNIYFTEISSKKGNVGLSLSSDTHVYKFDVQSQRIEQISVRLDPWPPYSHILVDHEGKIWLDALGFINEEGILYQLEKSPIFLIPVFFSGMDYRWTTPEIFMESSDGRLWFRSYNGIAWLDMDDQQWCWLTTSRFNVIEDANHNLWTTAYGKLYKRSIAPEF